METQINLNDFDDICRVCLMRKHDMSNFKSENIISMIEACCSVQVFMEDRLPNQICFDCVDQLLKSYNFKQLCEQSNRTLLKIASDYNKVKTEELEQIAKELTTLEPETDIKDESMEEDETNFENNVTDSETDSDEKDNEATENHIPKSQVLINHAIQMDGDKCEIKKLRCNICEKSFPTLLALARHMNTHQETRIITLNCKECGKGFSDPGNLTKHMNRHKGDPQYSCEECDKKFYELHPLALHMRKAHNAQPMKCFTCNATLYHRLQIQRHDRLHAQKVCNLCGKVCKTSKLLKRHKSSHSNNRPFSCDICDKSFKFNFEVTKHKKICHSGPQPREICSICGKSILTRSLPSHLKSHDKGTLYQCNYCPKSYYCEETLKQHVKHKHTNVDCHYKLLCSICGRKVISPKDLKIHLMSHTQEKSYECQQCDKKYKTPGALLTHVRFTHENKRPFSCSLCLKSFHTKIILQNHMRTHTGERPFACTVCERAFGSKSILKTHMNTHKDF